MAADGRDDRQRKHPRIAGFGGIIIVKRAAGRIHSVERVLSGTPAGFRNRLIDLSVGHAGKGAGLVNYPGNAVREGRMAYAI